MNHACWDKTLFEPQGRYSGFYETEQHSLTEVSHRETGVDITGPKAEWLLNAASPLELAKMQAPGAARTIFDHAQIILLKWDEDHYRIEVWNSFADHVWTLLELASNEVELAVWLIPYSSKNAAQPGGVFAF